MTPRLPIFLILLLTASPTLAQSFEAHSKNAIESYHKGDIDAAIGQIDKALSFKPNDTQTLALRAIWKAEKGDLKGSLADSNKAIEIDDKCFEGHLARGTCHVRLGEYDAATRDFTRLIELDPQSDNGYAYRAAVREKTGDIEAALEDYNAAIRIKPRAFNYSLRGTAKMLKNSQDDAIYDFDQAIKLEPESANHYKRRGNAKLLKGDLSGALEDLTASLKINPDPWTYHLCGCVNYDRQSWKEAIDDFEKELAADPDAQDAQLRIYLARVRLGQKDAARDLRAYFAQKPASDCAHVAAHFLGELSEADLLKASQNKDPVADARNRCSAHFYIASAYLLANNTAAAREHFQKSVDTNAFTLNHYASSSAELKRLKKWTPSKLAPTPAN